MDGDLTSFATRCAKNIGAITNSYGAVTEYKSRAKVIRTLRRENMVQEANKEITEPEVMEL